MMQDQARIRGLSELVLVVKDVDRARRFYHDVVGLRLERPPTEDWAWFRLDSDDAESGGAQRLAVHAGTLLFEEHSPLPTGRRFGPVHFAMRADRQGLERILERLRSQSVQVYGPTRFDWMSATSYYFYDPDGNLVELWSPDDSNR